MENRHCPEFCVNEKFRTVVTIINELLLSIFYDIAVLLYDGFYAFRLD